jgi:hypothetical protein
LFHTSSAMKIPTTLVLGLLLCLSAPAHAQSEKSPSLTPQKTSVPGYTGYGEAITPDGAITMEEFAKSSTAGDALPVKLKCEVITSCTKKGCWMDVKMPDGGMMKVRFKDYGFFVPTQGLEGKQAILQGSGMKEELDVATLRHYAHDAGKSKEEIEKITEPQTSWTFEAVGVLIKQ